MAQPEPSLTSPMLSLGIYGVGKAAIHPPALAILSHTPDGATQTIAWVGKGIVYDTGGLSMKGKVRCRTRAGGTWRGRAAPSQVSEERASCWGIQEGGPGAPSPPRGRPFTPALSQDRKSGEEEKVLG